jgi:hypothetical protein
MSTTPYLPLALPLSDKTIARSYRGVRVEFDLPISYPYEQMRWAEKVPEMIVTEGSIIFPNHEDRLNPLEPWTKLAKRISSRFGRDC